MKVLIMRHGESVDDITNQYGGWEDLDLTEKGKQQVGAKIETIKELGVEFEVIFSSPLKRARQSAEIVSSGLGVGVEIFEYAKERNTYGVLTGMVKTDAKEKYPDEVKNLDNDEYVEGSERYEDLVNRVKKSILLLVKSGRKNVILVTHGNYMKCLFAQFGKKLVKKEDGGFILVELTDSQLEVISSGGIELA